jgi:hypothetical protein
MDISSVEKSLNCHFAAAPSRSVRVYDGQQKRHQKRGDRNDQGSGEDGEREVEGVAESGVEIESRDDHGDGRRNV